MRSGNNGKTAAVITLAALIVMRAVTVVINGNFYHSFNSSSDIGAAVPDSDLESLGKLEAEVYIRDKYGFEADILDYYRDIQTYSGKRHYDAHCVVTMEHGGRRFYVYVSETVKGGVCSDSYQAKEIRETAEKMAVKALPAGIVYDFGMSGDDAKTHLGAIPYRNMGKDGVESILYKERFDGENLADVVGDGGAYIRIYSTETDLDKSELPDKIADELYLKWLDVYLYSCYDPDKAAAMDEEHCREKRAVTFRYGVNYEDSCEKKYN